MVFLPQQPCSPASPEALSACNRGVRFVRISEHCCTDPVLLHNEQGCQVVTWYRAPSRGCWSLGVHHEEGRRDSRAFRCEYNPTGVRTCGSFAPLSGMTADIVAPAKAAAHVDRKWVPAFAGMTA